jgi:hypothetical protein
MRGAPQVGFSETMRKIRSRASLGSLFLPARCRTLEISLEYIRKPIRCHPTTVSGPTTISEFFHADQSRCAVIQNLFIEDIQSGSGMPILGHRQLLPQSKIFEQKAATSAKQKGNRTPTEPDER